jgi:DUF4097 and DUF4098 domain-containing protein YvlB
MAALFKRLLTLAFMASFPAACQFDDGRPVHEEDLSIEQVPDALAVDVGSGDVTIVGADVARVSVTAKIRGATNHVGFDLTQGRLTLFDDCHEESCSVDLSVVLPAQTALNLRTGSGDIWLETTRAEVALKTGSGDIEGFGLGGLDFSAETGSGDVRFEVLPQANRVHVKTGSGDVALTVPSGGYRIDVSTGSGDRRLAGVSVDSSSASAIDVTTGSGDVSIQGR